MSLLSHNTFAIKVYYKVLPKQLCAIIQNSTYCLKGAAALLDCSHQHVIFLCIIHQYSGESIGLPQFDHGWGRHPS